MIDRYFLVLCVLLGLSACNKDKPDASEQQMSGAEKQFVAYMESDEYKQADEAERKDSEASVLNISVISNNNEIDYEPTEYSSAEMFLTPFSNSQINISILNDVKFDTSSDFYFNIAIDGEVIDKADFSVSATTVTIYVPLTDKKITVEMWGNDEDNLPIEYFEEIWLGGRNVSVQISHENKAIVSSKVSLELNESDTKYEVTSSNSSATFNDVHANNGVLLVEVTLEDGEIIYESSLIDIRNENISLTLFIPEDFYSPAIWESQ